MMVYHLKAAAADSNRDRGDKSKIGIVESNSFHFLPVLLPVLLSPILSVLLDILLSVLLPAKDMTWRGLLKTAAAA